MFRKFPFNLERLVDSNPSDYIKNMSFYANIIVIIFGTLISIGLYSLTGIDIPYIDISILNISQENVGGYLRVVCSLFISISISFLFIQTCTIRKNMEMNYILQKSHKAVDMLYKWSMDFGTEFLLSRHIVENLDKQAAEDLAHFKSIIINKDDYEMLKICIELLGLKNRKWYEIDKVDDKIKLSKKETIILRSLIVKYLNTLEVILCSCNLEVVDKDIIEQEFDYLVTFALNGKIVLNEFRLIMGQNYYPGIYHFCERVLESQKRRIEPKDIK